MKKGLLVGAGFSYSLGMPLITEFTSTFLSMFNESEVRSFANKMSKHQPYTADRPINGNAIHKAFDLVLTAKSNSETNYEQIIARLQAMDGIEKPTQSDRDSYHYVYGFLYSIVHVLFCHYQRASYEIFYPANKQWYSEFDSLLSEDETWVFSLNHDLYIECLALDYGIPITFGSTGKITFPVSNRELHKKIEFDTMLQSQLLGADNTFFKKHYGINLVKLHGGISEFYYKDRTLCCNLGLDKTTSKELIDEFFLSREMAYYDRNGIAVPAGESDRIITNVDAELDVITSSLLTGENKFSKTSDLKDGEEKLQLLDTVIRDLDELTIIGYGFGDKHVNFRISNAMVLNPNLHLKLINPSWFKPDILEQFDYGDRIRGGHCGAAEWMYYNKYKTWNTTQIEALKNSDRQAVKTRVMELLKKSVR